MNLVFRTNCHAFHIVSRLALPFLPYRNPTIYDSVTKVAPLLRQRGVRSALLVTDASLRAFGTTQPLESLLAAQGIRCAVYDQTRPNPTVENVEDARQVYLQEGCQCLIAFGGGSCIDCAKAVGARIAYPKRSLASLKGLLHVRRKIPYLIAIPTTAGTGSEVTLSAVVTDPAQKHKYTMNNFTFIPSCAVLDPQVTFSLPPALTATTGMDALTHAVEAYIGHCTNRETRALAKDAVKLVVDNIEKAYRNGSDRSARANMLIAAHKAGIAFSKSYVGYVHAVAHSICGQYNIPHGLANAVLLPIVLEAYGPIVHKKLRELAVFAGIAAATDTPSEGAGKFIQMIRSLNQRMQIPARLSGIQAADIPRMAACAAQEANPLYPVPTLMDARQLERFYYLVSDLGQGQGLGPSPAMPA